MNYEVEEIPNSDSLYMRVHIYLLKNKDFELTDPVPLNIFREHYGAMSTDWNKYSKPERTRQRSNPRLNGVIDMNVGKVRNIPPLAVRHTPRADNRAHTNVYGINQEDRSLTTEVRVKLSRISH